MHSPAAGDRASEDSTTADEAATADVLPALLNATETCAPHAYRRHASPGKPDIFVASPDKPDFFVPLIVIDELPCARRQDVMAAVFALRHLLISDFKVSGGVGGLISRFFSTH